MTKLNNKHIKMKKAVTPIIAVIMLLLITLSLAGMAMVIFNQLGKQSQAQIKQQLTKMKIEGRILEAKALPNNNTFNFTAINEFTRKLPVDGTNTEFIIEENGIPTVCKVNDGNQPSSTTTSCECISPGKDEVNDIGMDPGKEYNFTCTYKNKFTITNDYQLVWIYKEDGRELARVPIVVG